MGGMGACCACGACCTCGQGAWWARWRVARSLLWHSLLAVLAVLATIAGLRSACVRSVRAAGAVHDDQLHKVRWGYGVHGRGGWVNRACRGLDQLSAWQLVCVMAGVCVMVVVQCVMLFVRFVVTAVIDVAMLCACAAARGRCSEDSVSHDAVV